MRTLVIGLLAVAATLSACGGAAGEPGPRYGTSSAPPAKTAPSGTPLPSGDPGVDDYGY